MTDEILVHEPVNGEVHITADHNNGEWIILGKMNTLDVTDYR